MNDNTDEEKTTNIKNKVKTLLVGLSIKEAQKILRQCERELYETSKVTK